VASVTEDRYGSIYASLPAVLDTLARFKLALSHYAKASGRYTHIMAVQPRLLEALDVVDGALYRITTAFYPEMSRVHVAKGHASLVQSYLDYAQ
jgi:hypothetical protein